MQPWLGCRLLAFWQKPNKFLPKMPTRLLLASSRLQNPLNTLTSKSPMLKRFVTPTNMGILAGTLALGMSYKLYTNKKHEHRLLSDDRSRRRAYRIRGYRPKKQDKLNTILFLLLFFAGFGSLVWVWNRKRYGE